jgi:hypothetical protein
MKIVDGNCPYCDEPVNEKPGRIGKQINCSSCGRLLNLPSIFADSDGKKDKMTTIEPGLLCTFFVGIGFFSSSVLFLSIVVILSCGLLFLLWTQEDFPSIPDVIRPRILASSERLRIFPFELYLAGGWALVILLCVLGAWQFAGFVFCFLTFLAAIMAIQANRLYREAKVTSSKVNLLDFALFLRILIDPSTAFDRQKSEKGEGETYSTAHFTIAEAERAEKDQLKAEDLEELARRRSICINQRKKWEEDIDERYNKWLEEEYSRFQTEK